MALAPSPPHICDALAPTFCADPQRPPARAPAQRHPPEYGCLRQPRQRKRFLAERIAPLVSGRLSDEPQPDQAPVDPPHHAAHVGIGWWSRRMNSERVVDTPGGQG